MESTSANRSLPGTKQALASGMAAMRPRGIVLQLGLGGDMQVPMMMTAKELEIRGPFRSHEEFATAVLLMRKGFVDVKPLISHSCPSTMPNGRL